MRELEDGSLQDHTSEDAFVMADIVRGTPRWFHRVLLTSIFATATGIAALYVNNLPHIFQLIDFVQNLACCCPDPDRKTTPSQAD